MKMKRSKLLIEPPSSAASDIAFILIIFFLVCASVQPDSGRAQVLPKAETKKDKQQQSKNIEVAITRGGATINGNPAKEDTFVTRLRSLLAAKDREEDRIVVVKSKKDVAYHHWIRVTAMIEDAGGIITLQIEEERTTVVN